MSTRIEANARDDEPERSSVGPWCFLSSHLRPTLGLLFKAESEPPTDWSHSIWVSTSPSGLLRCVVKLNNFSEGRSKIEIGLRKSWNQRPPNTPVKSSISCLCFSPNAWVILSHGGPMPSLYQKHSCHSSWVSHPAATTKGKNLPLQPRASSGPSVLLDKWAFCCSRCPLAP